jgi:Tol biopolymer transport system component
MTPDDGLNRRLSAWLEEEAAPRAPGELRLRFAGQLARTRQRPGWATTERWISMETRARLGAVPRAAIILATLALLTALAAGAFVVGSSSSREAPPPFGPAANGLIAFSSEGDIIVVEPDGSGRRALTSGPETDIAPHWSRDGSRLAFWSGAAAGGPPYALKVVPAAGGEPLLVAETPGGEIGRLMTWSADDSEIAYSAIDPELTQGLCRYSAPDGGMCGSRIYVAAADGSGTRQIGDPELDARNPELSPDGRTLAFGGGLAASGALYLMDWSGDDVRRITSTAVPSGGWSFVNQRWSDDSATVVTQAGYPAGDIWLVEADGSGETNLTGTSIDELVARFAPGGDAVTWTGEPDTMIWFSTGGEPTLLATDVFRPFWSPDGELLVGSSHGGRFIVIDREGARLAEIEAPALVDHPSWQRLAP